MIEKTVPKPVSKEKMKEYNTEETFDQIRRFWNDIVCGQHYIPESLGMKGDLEYFHRMRDERTKVQHWHHVELYGFIEKYSPQYMLEIGCGIGHDIVRFAQLGNRVVGVDLADDVIRLAQRYLELEGIYGDDYGNATVQVANAEKLPFGDETFDCVVSGVLQHTVNPQKGIDEIYRVLKPGGRAHVLLYNRHSLNYLAHRIFNPRYEDPLSLSKEVCPFAYHFTKKEVLKMVGRFSQVHHFRAYLFGTWKGLHKITPDFIRWKLGEYVGWFHKMHLVK
ncbi:MAG: methyltransferase domain-containing protein [bacterium]|nr:methyltransferase domain-containing protein [bacterium]